ARPQTRERVQAVRERLSEHDDVGAQTEVLGGPELARAEESHLDLVVDDQDLARLEDRLEPLEVAGRRDHVATRPLNHFHEERRVLRLTDLGVPDAVVLAVEEPLELVDAVQAAVFALLAVRATEAVREGHELRAVSEVTVAAAVAVA